MKKSSFWTFVFSLFPGAGHMYLGLMKKGASLMLLFCFVFALSGFFNLTFLMMFLPVIWFYSFFDEMNLRHIPYEDRLAQEDHFLFDMGGLLKKDWLQVLKKRHLLVGIICIFLGAWILFQNVMGPYLYWISDAMPWLYHLINNLPTILVATAIIVLGVYLVTGGKKKYTLPEQDYVEYGGDGHDGE